jgi:two-component system LytT family sensor kinase
MKELKKNPLDLNTIELWASTSLYVFSIFVLVTQANYGSGYRANYYGHYSAISGFGAFVPRACLYTVLYGTFLIFNFRLWPALVKREFLTLHVILLVMLFGALMLTYAVTDTYLDQNLFTAYPNPIYFNTAIFIHSLLQSLWVFMMLGFYTFIKYASVYLLNYLQKVDPQYYQVTRESIIGLIGWLVLLFLLISTNANPAFIFLWGFSILLAIFIYWTSAYWIIPEVKRRQQGFKHYMARVVLVVLLSVVLIAIMANPFGHNVALPVIMLNSALQILIVAPISWQIYKIRSASDAELYRLKTELGQSTASYNMLQAQINPHFLFNALNTLYGTALQENAERTGEGIQMLGDMMRFMLHENMQQSISLTREIEYLHNYIALQKLRTQISPDIVIQSEIADHVGNLQITPMLLIPFVENAFKHGISLREPSHIKVTLQTTGNTLYFDVYNSIHPKSEADPEKDYSGIGLNNLKQRLKLIYPQRHELVIRETGKEFFVHLTLQLASLRQPGNPSN